MRPCTAPNHGGGRRLTDNEGRRCKSRFGGPLHCFFGPVFLALCFWALCFSRHCEDMPCGPNDPHALPIHTSSAFFPRGIVNRSLITLGANLGDPLSQMREGLEQLSRVSDIHRISSLYRTQPAGGPLAQPPFLNAVVSIETDQSPEALLRSLQKIETEVGRVRQIRWGPRVLDLDLALFGDETRSAEMTTTTDSQEADSQEADSQQGLARLALPHPRMAWRRFVL